MTGVEVEALKLADLLDGRAVYIRLSEAVESGVRLVVTSGQESVAVESCAVSEGVDVTGRRPTLVRMVGGVR